MLNHFLASRMSSQRCTLQITGLNPIEQKLFTCLDCKGDYCMACIDTCHVNHTQTPGSIRRGTCQCVIDDHCQIVVNDTISDLPSFKCLECRNAILLTLHVYLNNNQIEYFCDYCGIKKAKTLTLPNCMFVIPYISSMTWIKTKLRIEKANELATLYSNFIIPKDHRWKNIHWGYRCELCTRVIHGIRYQCMECITQESFCKECVHDHDSNHALLLVNKPIDLFSDAPLGIKEAQKLSEMDYSWDMSEISIDGTDIVIVNEMNLREILMTYQALVVGAGSLQESNELWPYVADALGSLYESLKEFKQKQNLIVDDDISTSELFFTICKKHFQNITLDDIENEHGLVRKRSSFTQSLYDRVYGKPVSKQTALDQTCIYFKNGTRTLFILRTKSEPKRFYRIELSNSDGRLMESDHIRPQFSMALNALLVGSVDSTPGLLCSD